jgi:Caspase domain/CarboxypepD_reg-like domain
MKKHLVLSAFLMLLQLFLPAQTRGLYVPNSDGSVRKPANEKRYALVIGNNSYTSSHALRNPINDAKAMSATLQSLGFEVKTVTDASRTQMIDAIRWLAEKSRGVNAVAMFFYSGHGLQVRDDNFLVPIEAVVQSEPDVEVACVSLNYLMRQLEVANTGTNIIVLDACRDNPFSYARGGGVRGLATPSNTPSGTFIAFSTEPRKTAADGGGNNSPYTTALLQEIKEPNVSIETAFKRVRTQVRNTIGQVPWENSSLEGEFYFNPISIRRDEPIEDSDGDGIIDNQDACPYEAGTIANRGCPRPVPTPPVTRRPQIVSGTITTNDGEFLIGAIVGFVDTSIATVTDIDGKFSIAIPTSLSNSGKLRVSYTGYLAKEVDVKDYLSGNLVFIKLSPSKFRLRRK